MTVAEDRLNAFLGRAVGDMAASVSAVLVLIGDELGLYSALAGQRLSPGELAEKTGTSERYVREWLANQAAGGYVDYDAENDQYYLNEEQTLCLADPNGTGSICRAHIRSFGTCSTSESVQSRTSAPVRAWSGASTIRACSRAP